MDPSATGELENEGSKHDSFPNGVSQCPGMGQVQAKFVLSQTQLHHTGTLSERRAKGKRQIPVVVEKSLYH